MHDISWVLLPWRAWLFFVRAPAVEAAKLGANNDFLTHPSGVGHSTHKASGFHGYGVEDFLLRRCFAFAPTWVELVAPSA
jgi:hypothetical protein